ncbi:hypothetical protein [Morganella morganii]|uniref:hypothetical protein n=1 Tax=Morganella morganii TaxID=582 RepID=UPI003EB6B68E
MKHKMFLKFITKFSDKKSKERRISLDSDECKSYDIYSVYMMDCDTKKEYLFEEYKDEFIYALMWDEDLSKFNDLKKLPAHECINFGFSGIHFYKGRRFDFKSLDELYSLEKSFYKLKVVYYNFIHTKKQKAYNLKQHDIENRMSVLDKVIEIFLSSSSDSGVNFNTIMMEIHSRYWLSHPERKQMERKMSLVLSSFVDGGELTMKNYRVYNPTGKAYITQSSYIDSLRKHEQGMKLQKRMFWTAVFSFLAAAISAGAAIYPIILKG